EGRPGVRAARDAGGGADRAEHDEAVRRGARGRAAARPHQGGGGPGVRRARGARDGGQVLERRARPAHGSPADDAARGGVSEEPAPDASISASQTPPAAPRHAEAAVIRELEVLKTLTRLT